MTVNKAELIAQIVAREGLSGEALLKRKSELEKMELLLLASELSSGLAGNSSMKNFGWNIERYTQNVPPQTSQNQTPSPKYSQNEQITMRFLTAMVKTSQNTLQEREKEAGPLSWCVNSWKKFFDDELAKSNVNKEIDETKKDIDLLEKAASGQITKFNFMTAQHVSTSFAETFKTRRGVPFSEKNIENCQLQSEIFTNVKIAKTMVDNLKTKLTHYTNGGVSAAIDNTQASKTIYDIFKMSGVSHSTYMNQALSALGEKYKNHPDVKKYGGEFQFEQEKGKIKNPPTILRRAGNGTLQPVTTEGIRVIAKELTLNLNKAYARALDCEVPQNASSKDIEALAENKFNQYKNQYEASFEKAYGKKDLKALSEKYVQAQQQGVANIELGINILSIATMFVGGGVLVKGSQVALKGAVVANNSATLGNTAKTLGLINKAKTLSKGTAATTKIAQKATPFVLTNMLGRPVYLAEQILSENGMSQDEWMEWGESALLNAGFMAAGLGSAKLAQGTASWIKTKGLINILKSSGKSLDEIAALVKANPVKFPPDIIQKFASLDKIAKGLQVSTEVALDLSSTYAISKSLNNEGLATQDWILSTGFALSGGFMQKQFASLSKDTKVNFIENTFKEIKLSKEDAIKLLQTMDDISAGKVKAPLLKETITFNEKMVKAETKVVEDMIEMGLGNEKTMTHRPKSVSSLYSKMHEDYVETYDIKSSLKSVRDGVGTRTELAQLKLADYPELIELHKIDPKAAYKKAAQIQTQEYVEKLKKIIETQALDANKTKALSISNYMGENGIPYLSKTQVDELRAFAASKGITNFKAKTGVRDSGYTALQMNFKHSNGVTSEWQLRGHLVNKFAEFEHVPYDLRTGKDISGGNVKLEKLYSPFKKLMENMPEKDYNKYMEYLSDYYKNLRIEELGFKPNYPKLPSQIDFRLSADGLKKLHFEAKALKDAS